MSLRAPTKLPYFANGWNKNRLQDAIKLLSHPNINWTWGKPIMIRFEEKYVLKVKHIHEEYYDPDFGVPEVDNMLYLEQTAPGIAPRLYAAGIEFEDNYPNLFIVEEYVPGKQLKELWPSLTSKDKRGIRNSLKATMQDIRELAPPPNHVGRVTRAPFRVGDFFGGWSMLDVNQRDKYIGPWKKPSSVHRVLVKAQKNFRAIDDRLREDEDEPYLPRRCQHQEDIGHVIFMNALNTYHPNVDVCFSHMDLDFGNILVHTDHNGEWKARIIGWEKANWWHASWEFAKIITDPEVSTDQMAWIRTWLEPYDHEAMLFSRIREKIEMLDITV